MPPCALKVIRHQFVQQTTTFLTKKNLVSISDDELQFVDLNEDNRMAEENNPGPGRTQGGGGTTGDTAHVTLSLLEAANQSEFTFDLTNDGPMSGPGRESGSGVTHRHGGPTATTTTAGDGVTGTGGGFPSPGSLSPPSGSPQHSPLHSAMGTVPSFPRQRSTHRDRLPNIHEETMNSFSAEDRGFEIVPRPENPVEAHRIANNYMVSRTF